MYRIFAVLCIVGCTLAEEKPITPGATGSRRLKTRQALIHGFDQFLHPAQPVHHVVDYLHEPQVVGSAVHYVEPSVVTYEAAQPGAPLVHPVGIHSPNLHQIYNYVPSVGYGHPFTYRHQVTGSGLHSSSSVSPATSSVIFTPGSTQRFNSGYGNVQSGIQSALTQGTQQAAFTQGIQQSPLSQGTQQSGFPQGTQQSGFTQGTQQSGFAQGTQQSGFAQGAQQSDPQPGLQTENIQALAGQTAQQTESQQSGTTQNVQGSQQSGRYQFGFLHSGFGQQQQIGIVQTPTTQDQTQVSVGQEQQTGNLQSSSRQAGFGTSQQYGSASQQSSGTFSSSPALTTVANSRQSTQADGSQTATQQTGGASSPASTVPFNTPVFGSSTFSGAPSVRLIQPYNLSPSYAIHGLGFRTLQPGVASTSSGTQTSQGSSSGSEQSSFTIPSQQFTSTASGGQFRSQDQTSATQSGSQASFRGSSDSSASSGVQYNQLSAGQPATIRSGFQSDSSSSAQGSTDGPTSGGYPSFFRSGVASQESSSGSSQTSTPSQQPAILRMSNEFSNDGSFTYGFESENGISSAARGSLRTVDPQHPAQVISGTYSYTAPDGTPISTNYYADETGFHAQGVHLPTPPPLPEYVARTLQVLPQQNDQPAVESN